MKNLERTKSVIIQEVTKRYLEEIDRENPPTPQEVVCELMKRVRDEFELENAVREKGDKMRVPSDLTHRQVADIILALYHVKCISFTEESQDEKNFCLLGLYQNEGENKGIYVTSKDCFESLITKYNYDADTKFIEETIKSIRRQAQVVQPTCEPDLIAVNNGIFNYKSKQLMEFTPENVFISKSRVNYNPLATNITIHNPEDNTDWDIESWMNELHDDPEIVETLWCVIGAIIRPHVRWNKSAWFFSESGNSGKGTLCELMRCICGRNTYASISLDAFAKGNFLLAPLLRATAIIVDENDVGGYIDSCADLKAVITNDVIQINRKFENPISFQFHGFMVQCLNSYPRIRDKSDSFYRRQLFIPFDKCFNGVERKYIKNDYLHRPEVLEYVLYKVLNMNFYELPEPSSCKDILMDYKSFNDPVRQFLDEVLPQCQWDFLPNQFLYDLYKSWFKKNEGQGKEQGRNTFIKSVNHIISTSEEWKAVTSVPPTPRNMSEPEPLIMEYDLKDWVNPNYRGEDIKQICRPIWKGSYNGYKRM